MLGKCRRIISIYKIELLVVFSIVWVHNSYFMQQLVPGSFRTLVPLTIGLVIAYLDVQSKGGVFFSKNKFLCGIFLTCHYTLTSCIKGFTINNYIAIISTFWAAILLSEYIEWTKFKKVFCSAIAWICVISAIFYYVERFLPQVLNLVPDVFVISIPKPYGGNSRVFFYSFYVTARDSGYYRNHGIFVEPGMFQVYINFALALHLFDSKRLNYFFVISYLLGMYTCLSTTGLLVTILIIGVFFLNNQTWKNRRKLYFILSLLLIVVMGFAFGLIDESIFFNLSKLTQLTDVVTYGAISSGAERKRAIIIAIKIWMDNFLLGVGGELVSYIVKEAGRYVILTCSPLNWFASLGTVPGVLFNALFLGFAKKINQGLGTQIIIWMVLLLTVSTQSMETNLFLVTLCFVGWNAGNADRNLGAQEHRGRAGEAFCE